jgi:hypothetical protein
MRPWLRALTVCIGAAVLFSAVAVLHSYANGHPSPVGHISFMTVSGVQLKSLYDGVPADAKLLQLQARLDLWPRRMWNGS